MITPRAALRPVSGDSGLIDTEAVPAVEPVGGLDPRRGDSVSTAEMGGWSPTAAGWIRTALLLLVVLGGMAFRLGAVGYGTDTLSFQIDEHRNVTLPLQLSLTDWRPRHPDYNVHYDYPALLWYLLFAFDRVAFWVAGQFHLVSGDWEQSNLFATNQIAFFLLGRTLSVAFGTATLGVCYLLGRRLFSPAHGLLAAAFLACTFLHVRDSALATVDVPMTFFVGLSLLGAANVLRQGRTQDYLLAGVAAGLATATKYSAVLVPIALLVAHGVRTAWLGEPLRRLGTAPRLVAAVSSAALVFLAVNPYLLLDGSRAWADLQWLYYERLTVGQFADVGPAWWYHFAVSLRYGMGVGLLALALAGILGTIWRRDAGGLVLLSFAGCFYLVTGYFKLAFVRYMIPLLPVLCLFAAWALLSLTERFPRPARGWIAAGLGVLAVLEPVHAIGAYSGLVHHPDTRVQAYAFLRALPPGTQVAVYEPDVVWRSTIPSWRPAVYLDDPQHASPEVFADLKRQGIGYLLVHTSALAAVSPTVPELELALRRSATLAQAFSPYKTRATPHPVYDRVDPYYFPIGGFAGVVRPGPLVRLYRLD